MQMNESVIVNTGCLDLFCPDLNRVSHIKLICINWVSFLVVIENTATNEIYRQGGITG